MQLAVMAAAQRHRELVTYFLTQGPPLRIAYVMGVARLATANQARMRGNESQMSLVPQTFWFGDGKHALVDAARSLRRFYGCYRT